MKKILLALGLVAVMGLTSCLGDNDNDNQGLTRQEIAQCFNAIKGNYTGKLLCEVNNPNNRNDYTDTLDIAWSITADTIVVINQFPQAVFIDRIGDVPLREAIAEAAPAQFKAGIGFYKANPVGFLLYPTSVTYDIEYDGGSHKALLAFWINTYSYGVVSDTDRSLSMQLMVAGLYLDDNTTHNYLTNSAYSTNSSYPILITNAIIR